MGTRIWALIGAGVIVVLGGWFVFFGGEETGMFGTGADVEESDSADSEDDGEDDGTEDDDGEEEDDDAEDDDS